MIGLRLLLPLFVVGLCFSSALGRRSNGNVLSGLSSYSNVRSPGDIEKVVRELLKYKNVHANIDKLIKKLKQLRDWPTPFGGNPINNRESHEVGQYLLILDNAIKAYTPDGLGTPAAHALNITFGDSMSHYADSYSPKIQNTLTVLESAQYVLQNVSEMVKKLSETSDVSRQLSIYLKYMFDNGEVAKTLINLEVEVGAAVKDVEAHLKQMTKELTSEGAGRYVLLNEDQTVGIIETYAKVINHLPWPIKQRV